LNAFKSQLDSTIENLTREILKYYGKTSEIAPVPFLSSLLDDCLEKGMDLTEGGTRYTFHAVLATGVSDTADSLTAIKKVVFEQRILTMEKLIKLLDSNFQGAEDIRQLLVNKVPKYGNDDDYGDNAVKELVSYFTAKLKPFSKATVKKHPYPKEIRFLPGIGTFERYILSGKKVGATPNGRLAKGWISVNFTPVPGADMKGPTSTVKSFTKIDFTDLPMGAPLDLRLNKKAVEGEEGLKRLVAFVRSFLELGGNMLSINVNDTETLRKAQKEPEKYKELSVRVGGYQAYFVLMNPEHQEHHINRTEHGLV
jgi:formate C-acetyltransferase